MTRYHVRKLCETETGNGKGFHYFYTQQDNAPDDTIVCPDHAEAVTRDFVVEWTEEV